MWLLLVLLIEVRQKRENKRTKVAKQATRQHSSLADSLASLYVSSPNCCCCCYLSTVPTHPPNFNLDLAHWICPQQFEELLGLKDSKGKEWKWHLIRRLLLGRKIRVELSFFSVSLKFLDWVWKSSISLIWRLSCFRSFDSIPFSGACNIFWQENCNIFEEKLLSEKKTLLLQPESEKSIELSWGTES